MDSEGGGSSKNHVGPQRGEGVLEAGPRGQNFSYTAALKMLYCCVNLVFSFEQLYYEFLL